MKEMKRFEALRDKFTVTCNKCNSIVTPYIHECGECGHTIEAYCNCGNKYSTHDWNMRLATYNDRGDEISSVPIEVDGGGERKI